jgi:hypothetical protein
MAITPLNSFPAVQQFIDQILTQNGEDGGVAASPHAAFWRTMSYGQFVNGNVPGVTDDAGNPMKILVIRDSANSNLIQSLRGMSGIFGPDGSIGQMPANGPPFFTADQIASIAAWIDNGCPQ